MINRVVLIGRLTRDPESRTTTTGKTVCTFSIAVNKRIKPQDPNMPDADFFRVTAWNQTAEYVTNYLGKGRLIAVDGRLEQRKFTDREGNERETIEVVADSVQGLDRPREDQDAKPAQGAKTQGNQARTQKPGPAQNVEYDPFADD